MIGACDGRGIGVDAGLMAGIELVITTFTGVGVGSIREGCAIAVRVAADTIKKARKNSLIILGVIQLKGSG